ncbi:MAG: aldehyde dehydrogenase family protein [Lachnospiraceae bacterium]|nr:aldehyde dehydrogenase family protein [Lachnospiraceae bacterium]
MNVFQEFQQLNIEKKAFINGKYVEAVSGATFEKVLSYNGETILSGITRCEKEDIDIAVDAALDAYTSRIWCDKSPTVKKKVLLRLALLMEEHRRELALLDAYETGRAFRNYYEDSIPKAIDAVRYFAESVDKLYDSAVPARERDAAIIKRVSLGVVGLITPWNDPMVVTCWKLAPALLMGNSVVLKPAEQSSLSAIRLAGLAKEAGMPDGVFNVVPGYGEIAGEALALHPKVRGISFTGSCFVGKKILQYAGQSNMKRVTLECGGKGPYIVTDKCRNIKRAAQVLSENMFYNQGQICSAPSRVLIHQSVMNEFMDELKKESRRFIPGDTFDSENVVGCVVSKEQYEKVQHYIDDAKKNGNKVWQCDEKKVHPEHAFCIPPTIITNVNPLDPIAREEVFGPVVTVIPIKTTEEAVQIANESEYGLAGAVWSDDLNEAYMVSNAVEVGLMHINSYGNDDNSAPFGGVKQSGVGKDKSVYAFDDFSDKKTIWMHIEYPR